MVNLLKIVAGLTVIGLKISGRVSYEDALLTIALLFFAEYISTPKDNHFYIVNQTSPNAEIESE